MHAKIFIANLAEALDLEAFDTLLDDKAGQHYPDVTYVFNAIKKPVVLLAY